jgi:SAM-dependent methyltransferase
VDLTELVKDTIPMNEPYDGVVAEAYDVFLPPDPSWNELAFYRDALAQGPALELGCGNGRLLLAYVAEGFDVEGVDSSADMLALCRAHADEQGLDVTLHHADWVTLDLGRRYTTLYNPAGSFALVHEIDAAHAALAAWLTHLEPGGRLMVTMGAMAEKDRDASWEWRIRRTGTRTSDGVTFMVHEALHADADGHVQDTLNRYDVWEPDGSLRASFVRRSRLRWWTQEQLETALRDTGYVDVASHGSPEAFMTIGRAP